MRVQRYLSAASKVAPKAERVPRNAAGISLSRWKLRRRHIAMSVFCTLKVLVSCMTRPLRTRFTTLAPQTYLLRQKFRAGGGASIKNLAGPSHFPRHLERPPPAIGAIRLY